MAIFPEFSQSFYKMQGSGNDFIIIDNRTQRIAPQMMGHWARQLCPRAFRIGADGIIFLEMDTSGQAETIWHFFNADGSRAEMCGNGARCATFLAHKLGMAPAKHRMLTDAGTVQAEVFPEEGTVSVQLTPPRDLRLNLDLVLDEKNMVVHFANTGVPHAVLIHEDISVLDIPKLGAKIRYHQYFAPAGTNANFVQILDQGHILLRTYERGVENETYACGTGAAASVAVLHALGQCAASVAVTTSGGEILQITLQDTDIFLRGPAQIIYQGQFCPAHLGL
jgi:diaminopimelate epimerase